MSVNGMAIFKVLTDCTTQICQGEVVVVCGPSGSGKSTLIKTVNGLEDFQQGQITVDGIPIKDPKTDLTKITQSRRHGVSAFRVVSTSQHY